MKIDLFLIESLLEIEFIGILVVVVSDLEGKNDNINVEEIEGR